MHAAPERAGPDPAGTPVFVLAAGTGRRLAPLTDRVPKPLVPIGGVPILERNVEALARAGYRRLTVNLHHLPHQVRSLLGTGERWGVEIDYSHEPHLRGTAGALLARRRRLREGTFLVVYGDNLLDCDLVDPLAAHRRSGAVATVAWIERADPGASGVLRTDASGRVVALIEKPGASMAGPARVNAGVVVAEPRLLDHIPAGRPSDLARDVLPSLLHGGERVQAVPLRGGITWIDTPADLAAAESAAVARR